MKNELDAALDLLVHYVQRFGSIKQECIEEFRIKLLQHLLERYEGHWYPDKPIKGQAYRSLEFNKENDYCDPIVSQICNKLAFAPNLLGIRHELTLWIDPYEVTIRLGNHASPKENQQLIVARFDKDGNELIRNDLDSLFIQSRIPLIATTVSRLSPVNSPCDSASCSGSSTPQRTSSPYPIAQQSTLIQPPSTTTTSSLYHNGPLFTPPRALSPQAPEFQMSSSAPIKVPVKQHEQNYSLQNNAESISSEGSPVDGNIIQPDRSDTPFSMNSTTSNESSDSGYCGYVESFPYYYKLNRLYKALAIQKLSTNTNPIGKTTYNPLMSHHHPRRAPNHFYNQYQQKNSNNNTNIIPSSLSTSPPTPTPMNINQLSPFYVQQSSYLPISTIATDSRKSKY